MKNLFLYFLVFSLLYGCSTSQQNQAPKRFPSKYPKALEYYVACEKMPEIVGGIRNIQNKVIIPEIAKNGSVSGNVYVNAYINESGTVDYVEIVKGLQQDCDNEALRVVKDAKFIPGSQKGKSIKMVVIVPIVF